MLQKKKKLSKKEIKEDKLITYFYSAEKFFTKYKNKILPYTGVVLIAVVAIYFYLNQKSENGLRWAAAPRR